MSEQRTDARLAADIARDVAAILLDIRAEGLGTEDGRELGRRGDGAADEYILARLAEARPGDAILSEESADDRTRLVSDRVWIVDPLDGSKEYGLEGHSDWAVHIALWERGGGEHGRGEHGRGEHGRITSAAVGQPELGVVYATDDAADDVPANQPPRIVVSGSRPPAFTDAVAAEIGADVVRMGSAGAKAMAVVRGDVDAYLHAGGQWEWDSAAPVGVAQSRGLFCSRIDGSPLRYNESHPYLPDLVICRPELAESILGAIRRHADLSAVSGRTAMAREYIAALQSHDATKVRFAADAWVVENGTRTATSGAQIRDELEHAGQYRNIRDVREVTTREFGDNVIVHYVLELGPAGAAATSTARVTAHFAIPDGDIRSITAVIEPV